MKTLVVLGLAASSVIAWALWYFRRDEVLSNGTLREIRDRTDKAQRVRDLTEQARPKRSVMDGPPTRAYQREVPRT